MRHADEVLSRTTILEHVWDFAHDGTSNVVDVYVRYLREKIDRPSDRTTLETVRGVGYRLRQTGEVASPERCAAGSRSFSRSSRPCCACLSGSSSTSNIATLREALDDGLVASLPEPRTRLTTSGDQSVEPTLPDSEAFAQIVDVDGRVVNAAPRAPRERRVLTKGELAKARTRRITIERGAAPGNTTVAACWRGQAGQRGLELVVGRDVARRGD